MIDDYDFYKIFNLVEFETSDLPSRSYTLILEDIGQKTILVTKGNLVSILYDDVFLSINLNDRNPFEFDGRGPNDEPGPKHSIYVDVNNNVWLGFEREE